MMNKKLLLLLVPMLLSLGACSGENNTSSEEIIGPEESSLPLVEGEVTVYFFTNASSCDKKNPFLKGTYEVGGLITAPTSDPTSNDPALNSFVGWSKKPYAFDESDIWNFEKDKVPGDILNHEFYLYGQWDFVG